jgi:hypothetical protein
VAGFRCDQLLNAQSRYDIHFTDRWQYHWVMEEGLFRRAEFRMTPVFLKPLSRRETQKNSLSRRKGCAAYTMTRAA